MSDKHLKIRKEYIDNEETDVELEEETDGDTRVPYEPKPYDPEKIRVDTHRFSLRNILDMIGDREIDLAPDFRRYQAWTQKQTDRVGPAENSLTGILLLFRQQGTDTGGHAL